MLSTYCICAVSSSPRVALGTSSPIYHTTSLSENLVIGLRTVMFPDSEKFDFQISSSFLWQGENWPYHSVQEYLDYIERGRGYRWVQRFWSMQSTHKVLSQPPAPATPSLWLRPQLKALVIFSQTYIQRKLSYRGKRLCRTSQKQY